MFLCISTEKEILAPWSQGIAFVGVPQEPNGHQHLSSWPWGPVGVFCGVLCGPMWHYSSSSSSSLKPEASPGQLPRLRHGVSPAEGKLRESGSQLPASSRQNCIRASPGFPRSLQSEHIPLPRKREGERNTEEKRETSISFLGWEALGFKLPLIL